MEKISALRLIEKGYNSNLMSRKKDIMEFRLANDVEMKTLQKQAHRAGRSIVVNQTFIQYEYQDNFTLAIIAARPNYIAFGMSKRMPTDISISDRGEEIALARAAKSFLEKYGQ